MNKGLVRKVRKDMKGDLDNWNKDNLLKVDWQNCTADFLNWSDQVVRVFWNWDDVWQRVDWTQMVV